MFLSFPYDFEVSSIQVPRAPCPTVHSGNDRGFEEICAFEHWVIHSTNTGPIGLPLITGKVSPLGASVNNAIAKNQALTANDDDGHRESSHKFTRDLTTGPTNQVSGRKVFDNVWNGVLAVPAHEPEVEVGGHLER